MRVLVTGGAGYIGSHVVRVLQSASHHVVVVDDLSTGDARRIPEVAIVELDLATARPSELAEVLRRERIDSVIHLAARKRVAESMERPLWYHRQNVGGVLNLLEAMAESGVRHLVFSSSAAVYGEAGAALLVEDSPTAPVNPYGTSKRVGEEIIADAARTGRIAATSLRYFNVAGAGEARLADTAATNLVPMVLERVDAGLPPMIFGDDYATPDGTCIRDYVHVVDLAEAHLAVLEGLHRDPQGMPRVLNVGTGSGSSVREVILAIERAVGRPIGAEVFPRRLGDPAAVVADAGLIDRTIGWRARFGLDEIVESAWAAWQARSPHPGRPL